MIQIKNYIAGDWQEALSKKKLENFEPATGKVYSYLPDSDKEDVELAVASAAKAFTTWSLTSKDERSQILRKIALLIRERAQVLAEAESRDQGKPVHLALSMDINRSAKNFEFFAEQILHDFTETYEMNDVKALNYTIRKPVGVAGLISPWNLPLYLLTWKIAPALAAGNTLVCKPSELTSMSAFLLTEILRDAGVPPGVANFVFGLGASVGDALVRHPKVPLISFTGGTLTGKKLMESAAANIKKLSLELGGKNANIIFEDADLDEAVHTTLRSSFLNQGEICLCGSRVFVEEKVFDKFLSKFIDKVKTLTVGDPRDEKSFMGALVSRDHLAKVHGYVELAEKEGGKVVCGREPLDLPEPLKGGYFMRPTVITGLSHERGSRVMAEEIFGPVVSITPFKTEDEVVKWNNSVDYGLSASLWTKDINRVQRLARSLEVGTLWVNTWMLRDLRVPFGGAKKSGVGREGGRHSLEFFSETTNVCIKLSQ